MGEKKKNRIALALGMAASPRRPLAREMGEETESPDDGGDDGVGEDAKREAGDRLVAALESKDGAAVYDAVCGIYDLEDTGGGAPEDEEEPYEAS